MQVITTGGFAEFMDSFTARFLSSGDDSDIGYGQTRSPCGKSVGGESCKRGAVKYGNHKLTFAAPISAVDSPFDPSMATGDGDEQ